MKMELLSMAILCQIMKDPQSCVFMKRLALLELNKREILLGFTTDGEGCTNYLK